MRNGRSLRQHTGALLLLALLCACTNNRTTRSTAREIAGTDPLADVITDLKQSGITLSRVIRNASNPTSVFDLVGDGSGAMGSLCTSTAAAGETAQGPSTCNCSYSYTKSDGTAETFETPTIYHESNLLRCVYTGIPAATTSVKVKIHITTSDSYSNEITYTFKGSGAGLDSSDPASFAKVERYQCRDTVTIPLNGLALGDAGMVYDRFQSEDPTNTYPLNYYTTNMGGAMALFAAGGAGFTAPIGYNCPSIPNDPAAGMDLTIYSVAADDSATVAAGKFKIYPPTTGNFDRSTFYLAKQSTGIFNVPVNAYVAPTIFTATPADAQDTSVIPPIGYGALPIPSGTTGVETCPDSSIAIPKGYHWVKVWLFRMALDPRKYLLSSRLNNLGEIQCYPGKWNNLSGIPAGPSQSVFPDCYNSTSLKDLETNASLSVASRYFNTNLRCVRMDPAESGGGPGGTWDGTAALNSSKAGFSTLNLPNGADVMIPGTGWQNLPGYTYLACKSGVDPYDYAHVCASHAAYDEAPVTGYIDADPSTNAPYSRYDYLFVVTPKEVMSRDMANSSSSVAAKYTPYRFMSPEDCKNPATGLPYDNPTGNCSASKALRNYGVKFHEVGRTGDPTADDPNRPGNFPVCALQPD
ncbi:MAG: hypothetical protein NDJ89_14225 [Oligoflexia bacterium]|nr:hypothetical protein [Oligoflexia bacterium]